MRVIHAATQSLVSNEDIPGGGVIGTLLASQLSLQPKTRVERAFHLGGAGAPRTLVAEEADPQDPNSSPEQKGAAQSARGLCVQFPEPIKTTP
jgi:hypothetical protein